MGQHDSPSPAGTLFVVSAPSGAGKTSLVTALVERRPGTRLSVSHTTRQQRPGETEGEDYYFVDAAGFETMVAAGRFLEHAEVFGNRYGTGRAQAEALLEAGHDVILEIDWQGAQQVRAAMPECVSIFVLPPSLEELERRLRGRGTDSEETIRRRLGEALGDMSHWNKFDFVVVNADFTAALARLEDVVAGRGEASRADQPELAPVVARLLA